MPEHVNITDPELHEPKGVAAAGAGRVYIADGAGSGSWTAGADHALTNATADKVLVSDGLGGHAAKTIVTQGFEDQNHGGGTQSLTASTWTDMLNDGAGTFTNTTYLLPTESALWDTINNEFDFAAGGLSLGDTVDIRVDITVTTTAANQVVRQRMDLAHGDAAEYSLEYDYRTFKAAGTFNIVRWFSVYMGDTATLNNPAKLAINTDASGTLQVNGWYVRVTPRNPRFV